MSLIGKMINQIEIKSDGVEFYEIFRYRPYSICTMCPDKIQACDIHEGEWGTVESVIFWTYNPDGKKRVAKEIVEAVDEEKRLVKFKVIGGDLMELYKTFTLTVDVDTNGEHDLVTWTLEYEKLNEDAPYRTTLMDFCLDVTKDIETHQLK